MYNKIKNGKFKGNINRFSCWYNHHSCSNVAFVDFLVGLEIHSTSYSHQCDYILRTGNLLDHLWIMKGRNGCKTIN